MVVMAGLGLAIGWILGRSDRDYHSLIQAVVGAGFVGLALTIVGIQANLVVAHQHTVECNTKLVKALVARNKAQVVINQDGVHFHDHLKLWLNSESRESQAAHPDTPQESKDSLIQLQESLDELIAARNEAIAVEQRNPLPDCR